MKPRNAKTLNQICSLTTECHNTSEGWILVGENYVMIYNQKMGEETTSKVRLSKRAFNILIDWYNRDQPQPPKKGESE